MAYKELMKSSADVSCKREVADGGLEGFVGVSVASGKGGVQVLDPDNLWGNGGQEQEMKGH